MPYSICFTLQKKKKRIFLAEIFCSQLLYKSWRGTLECQRPYLQCYLSPITYTQDHRKKLISEIKEFSSLSFTNNQQQKFVNVNHHIQPHTQNTTTNCNQQQHVHEIKRKLSSDNLLPRISDHRLRKDG